MPCLLVLIALFLPRVVIAILALFSNYMNAAYDTLIWPLLGFLFLPYTTLAYAIAMNAGGGVDGIWLVLVVIAVLADLGALGGGSRVRRRRID